MFCNTFLAFALFDSNDHSLAVDIGDFQADSLRNAKPSRITDRQDGAMLDALYAAQELQDLLRTQDEDDARTVCSVRPSCLEAGMGKDSR